MNAVAMMTPEPKYFAMKNAHSGIPTPRWRDAKTGNAAPVIIRDHGKCMTGQAAEHTKQGTDQYDEDGRDTKTYPPIKIIIRCASWVRYQCCCR